MFLYILHNMSLKHQYLVRQREVTLWVLCIEFVFFRKSRMFFTFQKLAVSWKLTFVKVNLHMNNVVHA